MDSAGQFHAGTRYRVAWPDGPATHDTVVFIHGVGMSLEFWEPQMREFSEGHRCIAYDMLGHGKSALPPAKPVLADYVRQLDCLMTFLGVETFTLVGHSMGALIAIEAALTMPQRVKKLVAMNAVYERSPEQSAAIAARVKALADAPPDWAPTLTRWFGDTPVGDAARKRQELEAILGQVNCEGYARTYGLFSRSDRTHSGKLQSLAMPALFLTGEGDPNSTPEMSRAMAAAAPYGQAVILPHQRHMMSFIDPGSTNAVLKIFFVAA